MIEIRREAYILNCMLHSEYSLELADPSQVVVVVLGLEVHHVDNAHGLIQPRVQSGLAEAGGRK